MVSVGGTVIRTDTTDFDRVDFAELTDAAGKFLDMVSC